MEWFRGAPDHLGTFPNNRVIGAATNRRLVGPCHR